MNLLNRTSFLVAYCVCVSVVVIYGVMTEEYVLVAVNAACMGVVLGLRYSRWKQMKLYHGGQGRYVWIDCSSKYYIDVLGFDLDSPEQFDSLLTGCSYFLTAHELRLWIQAWRPVLRKAEVEQLLKVVETLEVAVHWVDQGEGKDFI